MTALKSEDIDKVHEAVVYMEKCLGCPICLNLISAPVKTRCGHSFCHTCITSVLRNKSALCPLCKSPLKRRTITTDKHIEIWISKFEQLVSAIYTDTGVPILSHRILPYHTKEGHPTPSTSHARRVDLVPVLRNIDEKTQIIDGILHQPLHTKFSNDEAGTHNPSDFDESNDSGKAMASSSFITLAEGKEVSIRSLNHDQMKSIIGLQNTENDDQQSFNAKCDSPNEGTPSKDILPVKSQAAVCGEKSRVPAFPSVRGSAGKQTGVIINYICKELEVSAPSQKETPQRAESPLLKQNSDQHWYKAWGNKKLNLQINSVKRDLTKQMQDDQPSETTSMLALEIDVNRTKINVEKEVSIKNTSTIPSRTATPRIRGIKFKKLGKLAKVYIPKCHFIYYGVTKCKRPPNRPFVEKAESKVINTSRANLSDDGRHKAKLGSVSLETKPVSSPNSITDKKTCETAKDLSSPPPGFLQMSPFTSKDNFETESKEDAREPPVPTIRNTCDDSLLEGLDIDRSKERLLNASLTKTTCKLFNEDQSPKYAKHCLKSPTMEIRILNPARDSQLKYLSRQSPSNVRGNTQKSSNLGTADKRKKLIDGGPGSSLRPMKKRRRLLSQRNLQKVAKFGTVDSSDDSDLDYNNIVNATPVAQSSVKSQRNKLNTSKSSSRKVLTKKPRLNTSETVSLNHSSTGVTNKMSRYNEITNTTKNKISADTNRLRKEPILISLSDTDATHFSDSMDSADGSERSKNKQVTLMPSCLPIDKNTNTIHITSSASSKKSSRGRSHSNDNGLNVANKTLNSWCNDIDMSQNSSKRAKTNDTSSFVQLTSDTVSNKVPLGEKLSPKKRSDTTDSQTSPVDLRTSPMQGMGFFGSNTSCRRPGALFPVTSKNDIKRPKNNLNEDIIDRIERVQKNPVSSVQKNPRTFTSSPDLCANVMDIVKQVNMLDDIINDVYSADFDMEFSETSDCLNKEIPHPRIPPSPVQVNRVTFKKQSSNKENTGVAELTNRCNQSIPENLLIPCPLTKLPSHNKELRFDRTLRDNLSGLSTYSDKEDNIVKHGDTRKVRKCAGGSKNDVIQNITNTMNSYATEQEVKTVQRYEKEKQNHHLRQNISSKTSSTVPTASFVKNDSFDAAANDELSFNLLKSRLSKHTLHEDREYEQKDSYDLDSIFIITQQQMLLNEFEQNLFTNRITCMPEEPSRKRFSEEGSEGQRSIEEQLCTPRTNNRNLRLDNGDPYCPVEQEDVIENTPNTKVKNNARYSNLANLAAKRNLTESQQSIISKPIHTIYHSTPKRPQEQLDCTEESSQCLNSSAIRRFEQERMCLVGSGLSANQIGKVQKFAGLLSATYTNMFSSDVTHVVVSTKENNAADKTLKYLQGIAHKKWVVSFQWVQDCMNNMKLLNEEPYEAVDSTTLEPGPRNSRLSTKGFFEGFTFLCIEPFSYLTSAQYRELLTLTGGVVVETMQALIHKGTKLKFIVYQADLHQGQILEWYRKNLVPITDDWVVDCISQYKMLSLCTYLQGIQVEDVRALGYPEELLIEEELDSDN